MRGYIAALVLGLMFAPAVAVAAPPQYPPAPTQYVTDTAGALDASTIASLDAQLQDFQAKTGHHVLVWIGQTTGGDAIEDWTIGATQAWKLDKPGKSDSAVLFLFMTDHAMRIEVGYSLEPTLTDAISSQIIRNTMTPKLRAGDVDGAVTDGVGQMLVTIAPSYAAQMKNAPPPVQTAAPGDDASPWPFFIGFLILSMVIVSLLRSMHRGKHGYWLAAGVPFLFSGIGGGGSSGFGGGGFSAGGFGGGFGGGGASGGW
ncbi:MAG TPA: TPM domain-containing protein [Candidatus Baltobacteraceae bacterium]